jgi:hypothetical protein
LGSQGTNARLPNRSLTLSVVKRPC